MDKGKIYCLSNPALPYRVKIGYSKDVNRRIDDLYTSGLPQPFKLEWQVTGVEYGADKAIHKELPASLRENSSREFFIGTPEFFAEEVSKVLYTINHLTGSKYQVEWVSDGKMDSNYDGVDNQYDAEPSKKVRKPNIDFLKCGLKPGDSLDFIFDPNYKVVVVDSHTVKYGNEVGSISEMSRRIGRVAAPTRRKWEPACGPEYFTFNGESLRDIAVRTQWKDFT